MTSPLAQASVQHLVGLSLDDFEAAWVQLPHQGQHGHQDVLVAVDVLFPCVVMFLVFGCLVFAPFLLVLAGAHSLFSVVVADWLRGHIPRLMR